MGYNLVPGYAVGKQWRKEPMNTAELAPTAWPPALLQDLCSNNCASHNQTMITKNLLKSGS